MITNPRFVNLCAQGACSGPATQAVIDQAETALGVRFPRQYREFLSQFGAGVFDGATLYGLPDPLTNEPPLWEDVVHVTQQLRGWGQAGTENPANVPISDDGTGVYFFLDTSVAPEVRVVAVGPGVDREVGSDLFEFVVTLAEGGPSRGGRGRAR